MLLAAGFALGQVPWIATPPETPGKAAPALVQAWQNELKLLRSGSGADRLQRRTRIAAELEAWLPALLEVLRGGSHADQRQAILILLESRRADLAPALCRQLEVQARLDETGLALLLGKLADPGAAPSLRRLLQARNPVTRRAALVASGRLGAPEGAVAARAILRGRARGLEAEAAGLTLGLAGEEGDAPLLLQLVRESGDGQVRVAAAIGLGFLPGTAATEALLALLGHEDDAVARCAAAGIAARGAGPLAHAALARAFAARNPARAEAPVWVAALAAAGGEAAAQLLESLRGASTARGIHRVLAGAGISWPPEAARLWAVGWTSDADAAAREAALCTLAAAELRASTGASFGIHLADPAPEVRRTAILAEAAVRPLALAERLPDLAASPRTDEREIARELQLAALNDPALLVWLARVRLQVRADELGIAPSWLLRREAHGLVLRLLELENALPRGGGGTAPSGAGSGRPLAAATQRTSREEEDLRRHLDRHPYVDGPRRAEIGPVPPGS
jgi:hypothetical protein